MEELLTPAPLLDGPLPDVSRPELALLIDQRLRVLQCLDAHLHLEIGRWLAPLFAGTAFRELGHSHARDWLRARCALSVGTAYEMRDLASALHVEPGLPGGSRHPVLRRAFLSGALPARSVRHLLRVVTPETESGWVAWALHRGERAIAAAVRAHRQADAPAPPEPSPDPTSDAHVTVSWRATPSEAAAWHWGLSLLRDLAGADLPTWQLVEILAADAAPHVVSDVLSPESDECANAAPQPVRVPTSRFLLAAIARLPVAPLECANAAPEPDPSPSDAWAVHDHLQVLLSRRARIAFERATLVALLDGRSLHRELRFRSIHDYCARVLHLAPRDCSAMLQTELAAGTSPALVEAWRAGMPASVISLLLRVVTPATDAAWVAFARQVSSKRLLDEIRFHEAASVALGRAKYLELTSGLPDASAPDGSRRLDWMRFFGTVESKAKAASECANADDADPDALEALDLVTRELVTISFTAPARLAAAFRAVVEECANEEETRTGLRPSFGAAVAVLLTRLAHEHAPDARWRRDHATFLRDGLRCTLPECTARIRLHGHHVRFRSRGGSDDDWNITTVCIACHRLVHEGRVVLVGRAPDALVLLVGRRADGSWRESWRGSVRAVAP